MTNCTLYSTLPEISIITENEATYKQVLCFSRNEQMLIVSLLDNNTGNKCYLFYKAQEKNDDYGDGYPTLQIYSFGSSVKSLFMENLHADNNIFVNAGILTKEQLLEIQQIEKERRKEETNKFNYAQYLRLKEKFEPEKLAQPAQVIKPKKVYRGSN